MLRKRIANCKLAQVLVGCGNGFGLASDDERFRTRDRILPFTTPLLNLQWALYSKSAQHVHPKGQITIMHTRRTVLAASLAAGLAAAGAPVSARQSPVADEGLDQAIDAFYAAYGQAVNGDAAPMLALWSQAPYVSTMHAVGGEQLGWEQVQSAWTGLAERVTSGSIAFTPLVTFVLGETGVAIGSEAGNIVVEERRDCVRATGDQYLLAGRWGVVGYPSPWRPARFPRLHKLAPAHASHSGSDVP